MFQEKLNRGARFPLSNQHMTTEDYLDHLDLGIDEATGQKNVIVRSAKEFAKLPEPQQRHAWASITVASEILETTLQGIYYKIYRGTIPTRIVKRRATDLRGITLVKAYQPVKDRVAKREADKRRIARTLRRALRFASWIPKAQQELLVVLVNMKLREIERELFAGRKSKGITEGASHATAEVH